LARQQLRKLGRRALRHFDQTLVPNLIADFDSSTHRQEYESLRAKKQLLRLLPIF
jgi:hypothetical protein